MNYPFQFCSSTERFTFSDGCVSLPFVTSAALTDLFITRTRVASTIVVTNCNCPLARSRDKSA